MRITNNMMMHNTSNNINGNKINVDKLNHQMSSQKKIQRPSEDPVIAIRSLRFRSTLSEIEQYYERNIPDAEYWMSVTETAIKNMENILRDIRTQCDYGDNDYLKDEDRDTILTQLAKLREQVYAEGNADYAGRTVFTGYRTNKKLTFMVDDPNTNYHIKQGFSYNALEEHRYYSDQVTMPTTKDEVLTGSISDPKEGIFNRIRLSYGEIESLDGQTQTPGANPGDPATTTAKIKYSFFSAVQEPGTTPVLDKDGNPVTDADGRTKYEKEIEVTIYDSEKDWAAANTDPDHKNEYKIEDGKAVFLKDSGELVLADDVAADIRSKKADVTVGYNKTGFDKGELRPEYYYDCENNTDPQNQIVYKKFDEDGNEIHQDINYIVAANQTITVNTNASDVFDASLGRDVDALMDAVRFAIDANDKGKRLKEMKKMEEYSSEECQKKLDDWLEAANKECDYANTNMQKLYNSYIGRCDVYLEKINLSLTTVGSKGQSLDLIKNRMSNQQTTVETLKSTNEDRELSDIIIDYTAAYSAYEASLQAASKINKNTLLNYI